MPSENKARSSLQTITILAVAYPQENKHPLSRKKMKSVCLFLPNAEKWSFNERKREV